MVRFGMADFKILSTSAFLFFPLIFMAAAAQGQNADSAAVRMPGSDTVVVTADTVRTDAGSDFRSKVDYRSSDSLRFDAIAQIVYLYGDAEVKYENMTLTAAYIEVNLKHKTLYSTFRPDSAGRKAGIPEFQQDNDRFTADEIRYNFDTRKGKIRGVYTQQGEGYVYGETVKKIGDYEYIRHGTYTTCDLKDPHFAIATGKLKIINDRKIVSGPAYLTIGGVPTPLAIPFGFFPNRKGRTSGIIFPTYGESADLGFFLKNGGYYFGISDRLDLALTGDIYTKGSYGLQSFIRYANRYRYNGSLSVSLSEIRTGDPELTTFNRSRDFFVRWSHAQDPRARPNSVFSANINAGSSAYYRNNISTPENFLTNTFQSSVAYSLSFPNKPYSLSMSMSHSQNTQTRDVTVTFPNANFSVNRFYPFGRRVKAGASKWYEKIGMSYQANLQNTVQGKDTVFFDRGFTDRMRYGLQHTVPLSTSVKVLRHFTLSPSVNYSEKWYLKTIRKRWDADSGIVRTDTVDGFRAAREFSASASLNTRIYGMFQFRKGRVMAIRHVMSPSLSFSYRPDLSDPFWKYYREVQSAADGSVASYSVFENAVFGGPGQGLQQVIGFGLDNNLEMKVRKQTDSAEVIKKVKLFESLSIGGSYNLAADSLKLSSIAVNARTTVLDRINLTFGSTFNPYAIDSAGRVYDRYEWAEHRRPARLTGASGSVGFNLLHAPSAKKPKASGDEEEYVLAHPGDYIDLEIPYSLSVNYSLFYARPGNEKATVTQTVNFNGDLSLTPKWKIIFSSGYDLMQKQWSYTSLSFYRDLHCWEMRLNWVPLGGYAYWNFQINVKASVLQDLKLTKKRDYYDY